MNIEILYTPNLTNPDSIVELVENVLFETAISATIQQVEVSSEKEAVNVEFLGSPTIRVDGIDVEPNMTFGKSDFGLRSRSYEKDGQESAIPSRELIEETVEVGHLAELNMLGKCC